MNEETSVPTDETVPPSIEPLATEVPETAPEATDGTVILETTVPVTEAPDSTQETIWEDLSGVDLEETTAETTEPVVIVDVIESVGSDIIHATLFSGFLICGTLVGIAFLRKIYGT